LKLPLNCMQPPISTNKKRQEAQQKYKAIELSAT
jgi:hypothetical protein